MYHSLMAIALNREHICWVGTPRHMHVTKPTDWSSSGAVTFAEIVRSNEHIAV